MKIVVTFDFTDKRNEKKFPYMIERFKELFLSMPHPVYLLFNDENNKYVSLKEKGGVVEYRAVGTHEECINIMCQLKELEVQHSKKK